MDGQGELRQGSYRGEGYPFSYKHLYENGWVFHRTEGHSTIRTFNAGYSLRWVELENLSSDIAVRELRSYGRTKAS